MHRERAYMCCGIIYMIVRQSALVAHDKYRIFFLIHKRPFTSSIMGNIKISKHFSIKALVVDRSTRRIFLGTCFSEEPWLCWKRQKASVCSLWCTLLIVLNVCVYVWLLKYRYRARHAQLFCCVQVLHVRRVSSTNLKKKMRSEKIVLFEVTAIVAVTGRRSPLLRVHMVPSVISCKLQIFERCDVTYQK